MIFQEVEPVRPRCTPITGKFVVGVDLGQTIDPTAIAVLEVLTRQDVVSRYYALPDEERDRPDVLVPDPAWFPKTGPGGGPVFSNRVVRIYVRHLERLPLRTNYVDVMEHVRSILRRPPLNARRRELVLDATGVGRGIVDVFRRSGLPLVAVTITGGTSETKETESDWKVSKLLLVSRMQALLHTGELEIAKDLTEARTLAIEMQDFRANISETGLARFGAREGAHDDLVLAVAIGVWRASWSNYSMSFNVLY